MARQILVVLALIIGVARAGLLNAGLGVSTQSIVLGAPSIGLVRVAHAQPAVSSQSIQRISQSSIATAPVAIAQHNIAAVPVATRVLAAPAVSSQSIQRISLSSGIASAHAIAQPAIASVGSIGLTHGIGAVAAAPALTNVIDAPAVAVRAEPVDLHPQYRYSYSVQDPHTGDVKSASEVRDGGVVHGQYSLIDPDGTRRVVDYVADSHNGFNAVVRREPLVHNVAVAAPVAVGISNGHGLRLDAGLGQGLGLAH